MLKITILTIALVTITGCCRQEPVPECVKPTILLAPPIEYVSDTNYSTTTVVVEYKEKTEDKNYDK